MKHRKRERFDTPRTYYSAFRELLTELLAQDNSFKASYLASEVESKLLDPEFSDSAEERRSRAIVKWLGCEVTNQATNTRLMHHNEEDFLFLANGTFPVMADEVIRTARRFVSVTLGDRIPWTELKGSFSGGASTSVRRGLGTIARKYQEGTDITEDAIRHFLRLTKSDVWAPRDFTLARGNVMFTVPKTSLIDRCACKEPEYNMYVQKAVGDYIRRRLRMHGINLNDQSVNQRLAEQGSRDGSLATIDLSSASDSVTTQLVLLLVPDEWFDLMNDIRSKVTIIDGEPHLNEMFSSMGNGFTFELESLIFWALVRACAFLTHTKGRISVYGDDIICPVGLKDAVGSTLEFCGFRVNQKKTFFEGPFRESCGKHWYSGIDVTPFYIKEVPHTVVDWIHILNRLRKWANVSENWDDTQICDPRYYDLWSLFAELVPEPVKGHWDLALKSNLCSPGRRPIAKLVSKQERDDATERRFSRGAYIHWLAANDERPDVIEHIETSRFVYDGALGLKRCRKTTESRSIPVFPQEIGVH